jgi:deoxyribonuclease V
LKIPRPPHNWSVSPRQAVAIQKKLGRAVRQNRPARPLRYIAGVDAAFSVDGFFCLAGVVLWDLQAGAVVESRSAVRRLTFPYIPGLLTFREAPAIIAALRRLHHRPDCLMCDGQGIAHPRRCGIATHLGLLAGLPSIGCAKSRLTGIFRLPGKTRGARSALVSGEEIIGAVLRTRDRVKPVFVSVGTGLDLDTAVNITLACGRGFRLPEPTRLADQLVAREKRKRTLSTRPEAE